MPASPLLLGGEVEPYLAARVKAVAAVTLSGGDVQQPRRAPDQHSPSARRHNGKAAIDRHKIERDEAFQDVATAWTLGWHPLAKRPQRFPLVRGEVAVEFDIHGASNGSRALLAGLLPKLREDRATEARRDIVLHARARRAPSHHFDDGGCLSANWIAGTDDGSVLVCGVLAKIAKMIEARRLQIDLTRFDFRQGGLGKNIGCDVLDGRIGDFVNETDVPVLAGCNPSHDLAPGDLGIDDRLAAATILLKIGI